MAFFQEIQVGWHQKDFSETLLAHCTFVPLYLWNRVTSDPDLLHVCMT